MSEEHDDATDEQQIPFTEETTVTGTGEDLTAPFPGLQERPYA